MENGPMTPKAKYIVAGVAAGAVVLAAAGAVAHRAGHFDGHHGGPGGHHSGMGNRGGSMGMMGMAGLGFGGPMSRFCRRNGAEVADHMLVRIEHRLKPTTEQSAAFDEFKTATRTAAATMQAACPPRTADAQDAVSTRTPIDRLAEAQAGLEASLEALKTFRPAAEKLYATLSDAQKAKLAERRRQWNRERPYERRERKDTPGNAPQEAPTEDRG